MRVSEPCRIEIYRKAEARACWRGTKGQRNQQMQDTLRKDDVGCGHSAPQGCVLALGGGGFGFGCGSGK
jgi:hypothetical protein